MLRSGSTSVLGRAYGVDEVLPLLVPASSGGVVDRLANPAARRRGGGDPRGISAGLRQAPGQRYVEKEREEGAASTWSSGVRPAFGPPPLYIGG